MNDPDQTDKESSALGDRERAWLEIFRHFCLSCERNDAEGWHRALNHAELMYGADDGPLIAARIAGLLRAMQSERRGGFGYRSPLCPNCRTRVSEDEWQLVCLMQAGRQGAPDEIEAAARLFARRSSAPLLAAAARRFGSQVSELSTPRSSAQTRLTLH